MKNAVQGVVTGVVWIFLVPIALCAENRVSARLISNAEIATPGSTIQVGVLFEMPARSHIYWRNPGESGFATEIEWVVPEGVEVGELQWPAPYHFEIEGLDEAYFGYTDEVVLFADVTVPETMKPGETTLAIGAHVKWLLCLDDGVCIPEDGVLKKEIPVQQESRKAYEATLLERYAESVPRPIRKGVTKSGWSANPEPRLRVALAEGRRIVSSRERAEPRFFPLEGDPWVAERTGGSVQFRPKYKGGSAVDGVVVLVVEEIRTQKRSIQYQAVSAPKTP